MLVSSKLAKPGTAKGAGAQNEAMAQLRGVTGVDSE